MTLFWDSRESSDQENTRFALLRAIEWANWPLFLSQPVVPLLLMFLLWPAVLSSVVLANLLWALVRYRIVSVSAAEAGLYFTKLKWVSCPAAAWHLYFQGHIGLAILALAWPPGAGFIGVPAKIGILQKSMMRQLGDEPRDDAQLS